MTVLPADIRGTAVRSVTLAFGVCSIAWAVFAFDVFRSEASIVGSARAIRSGENYSAGQLNSLRERLDSAAAAKSLRSSVLADAAVVRLRLLEDDSAHGRSELVASDRARLKDALSTALSAVPGDSFLWLAEYWLRDPADRAERSLRMSYLTGPNEGWIAAKRNRLAMMAFSSLPNDLTEKLLSEFADMVRSGFYLDASNIVADSGPELRKMLLGRTAQLKEADRRRLARVLASKDLEDLTVPGVEKENARPF